MSLRTARSRLNWFTRFHRTSAHVQASVTHAYRGHDFVGKINQSEPPHIFSVKALLHVPQWTEKVSGKGGNKVSPLADAALGAIGSEGRAKVPDEDDDAVAEFIQSKGITRCPTASCRRKA